MRRFRAEMRSGDVNEAVWVPCSYSRDPMQLLYYSWEAENHRKVGGWTFVYRPDWRDIRERKPPWTSTLVREDAGLGHISMCGRDTRKWKT